MTKNMYTDRKGRKLEVGQRVRVQMAQGGYGQTHIVQGVIVEFSEYHGATLTNEIAFNDDCGRFGVHRRKVGDLVYVTFPRNGYEKFKDFEHGHEKWIEIIDDRYTDILNRIERL